jgi:hypothetical protein
LSMLRPKPHCSSGPCSRPFSSPNPFVFLHVSLSGTSEKLRNRPSAALCLSVCPFFFRLAWNNAAPVGFIYISLTECSSGTTQKLPICS